MTSTAPNSDPAHRGLPAPALREATDRDLDVALRQAFAGLDAPERIDFDGGAPDGPTRGAVERRPWALAAAASMAFMLCAALPMFVVRSDLGVQLGEVLGPWILRCAPALALLVFVWLERPPAAWVGDAESR